MLPVYFTYLAVLLDIAGVSNYAFDTIKGRTQPNRVTWFFAGLAPLIAAIAQMSQGVGLSTLFIFACGLGPLVIFICSFVNKKAYWRIDIIDYACGGLALAGLIVWQLTKTPNLAILFSIAAEFMAMVPTLRKAVTMPQSENEMSSVIFMISALIGFLSIQHFNFASTAFNAYVLGMDSLICLLVNRRRLAGFSGLHS